MQFINRVAERADIRRRYGRALSSRTPFRLVVCGLSGIGKRTLVERIRSELADDYTGGTLHVDAYGDSPQIMADANDLATQIMIKARARREDFADREKHQIAAMQTLLAGKRWLIIVEGAGTSGQLRPLFAGGMTNVDMIVMSDNPISGLAEFGFPPPVLNLAGFGPDDGLALMSAIAGDAVAAVAPEKLRELSRVYLGVPGFLCAVARELRYGNSTVDDLIAAAQSGTIVRDGAVDGITIIGSALDRICFGLTAEVRRAYRLWSLKSGSHCRLESAAAMLDVSLEHAICLRRTLLERGLVEDRGDGRFRFPDLIRGHGAGLARDVDTVADRNVAELRGIDADTRYTVGLAKSISDRLVADGVVGEFYRDIAPIHTELVDGFTDFDTEYPNLIVGAIRALELLDDRTAVLLATALWPFAYQTARVDRLTDVYLLFRDIIDDPEKCWGIFADPRTRWQILRDLAGLCEKQGRLAEAESSLLSAAETDYPAGRASVLEWLGILYAQDGRVEDALAAFAAAWEAVEFIADSIQRDRSYALLRMHRGRTLAEDGRYDEALPDLAAALAFFRARHRDRYNAVRCLVILGDIALKQGRTSEAKASFIEGAEHYTELGMSGDAAELLDKLAVVAHSDRRLDEAAAYRSKAEALRAEGRHPAR